MEDTVTLKFIIFNAIHREIFHMSVKNNNVKISKFSKNVILAVQIVSCMLEEYDLFLADDLLKEINSKKELNIFASELYKLETKNYNDKNYIYIYDMFGNGIEYGYCYISPRDLKKILEIYIEEYEKFKANPEEYKKLVEQNWWAIEREVELEDEVESWVKVFEW